MTKSEGETTTAENLEAKFDRGEEVLDFFAAEKAKLIRPKKQRAGTVDDKRHSPDKRTVVRESSGQYNKRNPKTGDYAKRNETPGSPKKGEFMDVKKDGKPFKGVAKEPDKRRK